MQSGGDEHAHTNKERDEGKTLEMDSGLCAGRQVKCVLKAREWREILSTGRADGRVGNAV